MNLVVIDDSVEIINTIRIYGNELDYHVDGISDSTNVIGYDFSHTDLIILDVDMPKMTGFEVIEYLNSITNKVPVIFLSAKIEINDRIKGLKLGAEDYMLKPFSLPELFLKIQKILNRQSVISIDEFKIDLYNKEIFFRDRLLKLTNKAFDLLYLLLKNKNKVLSREEILVAVWDDSMYRDHRTVDTHIKMIRNELVDDKIKTIRSIGYVYEN